MMAKMDRLMIYGFDIHHSLLRSDNRRKILLFMKERSEIALYKATVNSVSNNLRMSPANVKGAIVGNGIGYNKDYSLVNLSLLGYEKKGRLTVYYLTPKGLEVAKFLEACS